MGEARPTGEGATTGGFPAWTGPAAWRDLGAIVRLYRAQPPASRLFYHPFPFDRPRLIGLLAAMVVLQRARRRTVRRFPALAPLLWVVRETGEGRVLGFGTATFHHDPARLLVVRTGLFVAPEVRRRGVGRLLKQTLLLESAKLGARRAEAILVASNEPSRELNRSLGYELRATEFHDRRAPDVELHIAERALDPPGGAPPVAVVRRPGSDGASAGTPARS